MASWVRVQKLEDGKDFITSEVVSEDPTGKFHPDIVWVEIPDYLNRFANALYVKITTGTGKNKKDTLAPPSGEYFLAQLNKPVAAARWDVQVKGILIDTVYYASTKDAIADINSAIIDGMEHEAENGEGTFKKSWKTGGSFTDLTLADFKFVKKTITEYIDTCFAYEQEVMAALTTLVGNEKFEAAVKKMDEMIAGELWPTNEFVSE